jgi:hypothetical protein
MDAGVAPIVARHFSAFEQAGARTFVRRGAILSGDFPVASRAIAPNSPLLSPLALPPPADMAYPVSVKLL